ncbi:putative secreted Zn-dependent protease [Agrobacterium vitis]|nr:putative secreted Zn-dependent protease [Agrobacterium vitis]MBE1437590.1 putative secreted Zn-dependent protease [Agrobacterium vitis]
MIKASGLVTCLTLALTPLLPAHNAHAETIMRKSIRYFTISGKTAAELDRQLETKGPHTSTTGARHPGATKIRFGGTMDYVQQAGRCKIGNIKVTLDITIIMPRWKNRAHTNPELALIWDTLAADIKRHEERHAEIALQHARDLDRRLKAMPSASSCQTLAQKVSDLTDKVTDEHDADQIRFDRIEAINFNARILRLLQYRAPKHAK